MNSLIEEIKVKLIEHGYCSDSVNQEIMPWLNKRQLQPTGRFKSRFDIYKDSVGFTYLSPGLGFKQMLIDYIIRKVEDHLDLKIVAFQK